MHLNIITCLIYTYIPFVSNLIIMQEILPLPLQWETSDKFCAKSLIKRHERKTEKGRGRRAEVSGEQRALVRCSLQSKPIWAGSASLLPSWCCELGEAIRAAALAVCCSRPPGHRKTAEPFFHKKKRPVSVAQALYHMLLLVEKAGQGEQKARVIEFSWLSSKENTSPTLNKT